VEAIKQARKIISSMAIAFSLILSACRGSDTSSYDSSSQESSDDSSSQESSDDSSSQESSDDSSSQESSAELTASDIDVSISCSPWRESPSGLFGETDCNIAVTNTSAASGDIYVIWDWQDGDKSCGAGFSARSDGLPADISVGAYESGTATAVPQTMMCSPSYYNPVPVNVRVTVRD